MIDGKENQLLIVGLGNPGRKYEMTRHNIGFIILEAIAHLHGWRFKDESRFEGKAVKGQVGDTKVHLLMPQTYMNESGRSVRRYLDFFKMTPEQVVVVVDDVDIPFGMVRLRESGGAAGHNGLKSIQKHIGTQKYLRMRMGIGEKRHAQQDLADHVLSRFTSEETTVLGSFVEKGVATLLRVTHEEISAVMNDVNKKVKKKDLPQGEQENNDEPRES
ncbi:MAG: aminoacyl-tRNA hydrolase [Chlamydiota bacterium]